jgi:hypothetical protein
MCFPSGSIRGAFALKKLSIDQQPTWPTISKNGDKLANVSWSSHVDIISCPCKALGRTPASRKARFWA